MTQVSSQVANQQENMQVLHESTVRDSEIDSLGHLNVRYYLSRVDDANIHLLSALGLSLPKESGLIMRRYDTYSRFRREQFAGADLQVQGGVLELTEDAARCYFEIRNPSKGELAASFVTVTKPVDVLTQQSVLFPVELVSEGCEYRVQLPKHAKPRSLSLDSPRSDLSLAQLETRVVLEPAPGMMSGRREAKVDAADCDAQGRLREDVDLMFVLHRPQPGEDMSKFGPPVMKTDEGHRFSWAMIETRSLTLSRPHAGDQLVSIGADVALGKRWRQSRRWVFVATSGELIGLNDTVGLALDLDERRSIDIPSSMRAAIERSYLPDLA